MSKKFGLITGTSYAVGSIIGSGVLFLPSLTYSLSGYDAIISWFVATILCIPLLIIFNDMSKLVDVGEGVKGFIKLGLGQNVANCFPIFFIATVVVGMPSSAIIVGNFVKEYTGIENIEYFVAIYLINFGILCNFFNKSIGGKIQMLTSVLFFVAGILLLYFTYDKVVVGYKLIKPDFNLSKIYEGVVLAFWAFAGFENLSFLTNEFKNPKRDFLLSMVFALLLCGAFYFFITLSYISIIPVKDINPILGLYQLSTHVEPVAITSLIIVILAIFALKSNFNAWIKGICSMISNLSKDGFFPKAVSSNKNGIIFIAVIFNMNILINYCSPTFLKSALVTVSSNFVLIYALCIISYLRTKQLVIKKIIVILLLFVLIGALKTSGVNLIYPFLIFTFLFVFILYKKHSFKKKGGEM